jgi:small subunit ribosomal protein S4
MRALGVELPGLSRKSIENRPHPPGQHGLKQRRKSDFGSKLQEKQKLRFNYGLSERQMRRVMTDARKMKGNSGELLLELLERRLDNLVFRAGFAPTIVAARQLVSHRHVLLNGKSVNIPSIRLRPGDYVSLREKASRNPHVVETLTDPVLQRPEWLSFEEASGTARMTRLPAADEVPFPIDAQRVVEYYANRL